MAPFDAEGLDWFAGMAASGAAELHAAVDGYAALDALLAATEFDLEQFTPSDHAALAGAWGFLGMSAGRASQGGPAPLIDDDLAYVRPWGFAVEQVRAPVLLVHGDADRIIPPAHSQWLARHWSSAELRMRPGDGHLSVLDGAIEAMAWLAHHGR
jgi:pimeloyl-ACP methyl ester carboxylesterase